MNNEELLHAVVEAIKDSGAHKIVCKEVYISHSLREELLQWADTQREDEIHSLQADKDRLRKALEKLARLGNGDTYGNSDGNIIAQEALDSIGKR